MAICGVSLILALLDGNSIIEKMREDIGLQMTTKPIRLYLTGQVIARTAKYALFSGFRCPRKWDFAKLNLHLTIVEQPWKDAFQEQERRRRWI